MRMIIIDHLVNKAVKLQYGLTFVVISRPTKFKIVVIYKSLLVSYLRTQRHTEHSLPSIKYILNSNTTCRQITESIHSLLECI